MKTTGIIAIVLAAAWCCAFPESVSAQQRCAVSAPLSGEQQSASDQWQVLPELHRIATGRGVTVAVIDTGISPHPRLPRLIDGGSYLSGSYTPTGGLHDCDAHGTVVASIIAGQPGPDPVLGVAPESQLISIQQTSNTVASGTVASLAHAIHTAIDQHAQIINISVVSCVASDHAVDDAVLVEALRRAEESGTVVVSAAGNATGSTDDCVHGARVFPAHYPTVLTVGALKDPYHFADYSMPSPFPLVSALGYVPAALAHDHPGISGGTLNHRSVYPFQGTSFAAPYVSGVAALIKQRFPAESPEHIRQRILMSSDPTVGKINPVHALTMEFPAPRTHHQVKVKPLHRQKFIREHAVEVIFWGLVVLILTEVIQHKRAKKKRE
ncbi:S8 family serine peptidase [Corynebacterium diphtheriae]|uniref:S8 family serine peptidase n=1 Tax=Corynebacterium diphtheriae TaxID=1717 RepID=UPI0013CA7997|nr:S8 family serine peptidase [Corynebacterium diphtheriae]MBG9292348.1 S8 family serine peptidase [Corynebacterium diphtheriae bv. gravis]MBG9373122.1 S8 family serine peptidase [Corynebacterium diphtheriae bv. gravis]CAB0682908.1 serine protease [Corynebacterium diphtheriae]CAB0894267.1 serine protease [Corynebacterium diphtheriae]CAB0896094.1 serine protease [Corynebacterium diphtheriae]